MMDETEQPLKESDLNHFTGTEQYKRWSILFQRMVLTDGAHYVAEKAGAFWLMDAIASHQPKILKNKDQRLKTLQIWELSVKDNAAVLTCCADTGTKPAVKQKIEYTDFPLPSIKFYVVPVDEIVYAIMLTSEY